MNIAKLINIIWPQISNTNSCIGLFYFLDSRQTIEINIQLNSAEDKSKFKQLIGQYFNVDYHIQLDEMGDKEFNQLSKLELAEFKKMGV